MSIDYDLLWENSYIIVCYFPNLLWFKDAHYSLRDLSFYFTRKDLSSLEYNSRNLDTYVLLSKYLMR